MIYGDGYYNSFKQLLRKFEIKGIGNFLILDINVLLSLVTPIN